MKKLELLSPARDLETGKAAIDAGADAVYIGAPKFGARSAVSNSIPDIEQLIKYAHFTLLSTPYSPMLNLMRL